MAPFAALQHKYGGAPGTPEYDEYEQQYKQDVNKLILGHLVRRIKATARRR